MNLRRRALVHAAGALALGASLVQPIQAQQERVGLLMLHGKNPGNPNDPNFSPLKGRFEALGWVVRLPDMPWSRSRYLEGHFDQAMTEIAGHVRALREAGATRIVLMGHSMGVPAAMAYAVRGGDVQALVALAPGHVPLLYDTLPGLSAVHDSIVKARELVAAGKGDATERFTDINQGRAQPLIATPRNFLSYFDPSTDAEMSVTAPRLPPSLPVLVAIGEKDPLYPRMRAYLVDRLPSHPRHRYLEVAGGHLDTPRVAFDAMVEWIQATSMAK
jgi:pimeloyl-ACP methyl ester carboxylesterase